ncbi:M48 family metalloprotease [Agrilutibacter solisilvae]|uniref:M48 family metalloprotease n=1 Tax=Agrilutibacter solisilvae TaxID=2763317 RepID=A0A975ARR7_9GAMM|nr:M48 family metalloprotease [Lysobacter solisilvae]QSX77230.1 M48 family metalloprotease [Lysobacter solisilvae]
MRAAFHRLSFIVPLSLALSVAALAAAAGATAVVHKPAVEVKSAPDFGSTTVTTLKRDQKITVAGQQGLWFKVETAGGAGFVRVNDVRMSTGTAAKGGKGGLFKNMAGAGQVKETAGVRGLNENDLKVASFNAQEFAELEANRVAPQAAAQHAKGHGLKTRKVEYAAEFKPNAKAGKGSASQAQKRGGLSALRGVLGAIGVGGTAGSAIDVASATTGKSEAEQSAEELALGPEIAGRVLGAANLVDDPAAQERVNRIGRWVASQTTRPDLPWSFGVIKTGDINAFAAPGGYILITQGLYELLDTDDEVAAVLGHEISHAVQRDHYNVIQKQHSTAELKDIAASNVTVGGGVAGSMVKDYVARFGASVLMQRLDQDVEYRSDEAAEIYLARAGYDPLALYMVLQKMAARGSAKGNLEQLYKTHPSLEARMDSLDGRSAKVAGYTASK